MLIEGFSSAFIVAAASGVIGAFVPAFVRRFGLRRQPTRRFENIVAEVEAAFRIHRELGSWLGGVHFELTGEDVTECTGGARCLTDADLARAYNSPVDPRLNYEQALELAMRIAGLHEGKNKKKRIADGG